MPDRRSRIVRWRNREPRIRQEQTPAQGGHIGPPLHRFSSAWPWSCRVPRLSTYDDLPQPATGHRRGTTSRRNLRRAIVHVQRSAATCDEPSQPATSHCPRTTSRRRLRQAVAAGGRTSRRDGEPSSAYGGPPQADSVSAFPGETHWRRRPPLGNSFTFGLSGRNR